MAKLKSFLLPVCTGLLLSFPWLIPGLSWTLFFAFVPLMLADDQRIQLHPKNSISLFYSAYVSFLIWNVLSTWWIAYVSITGMLLIVGINSLIMTAVWLLQHPVAQKMGKVSGQFSLIIVWLTFEFFQHIWALQWPWLTLGNGFANSVKIIQWYEYTGVLGGSLWILLANILIYTVIKTIFRKDFPKLIKSIGIALLLLILPISYSIFRYSNYTSNGSEIEILILQPNVDPYTQKFSGIKPDEQVENLISLCQEFVSDSTDLILAPETSFPDLWENSAFLKDAAFKPVDSLLNIYPNVTFIGGAITKRKVASGTVISETARISEDSLFYYDIYNSALMIDHLDEPSYNHKSILVSGVEKMPFQKYFSFLKKYLLRLGGTNGSLSEGDGTVFVTDKSKVQIGSVICFESAFGEYVSELTRKGAEILVVITNDGWWKQSAGVWQHFGYSRLRSIESRRDVARSANSGISGFINQRGDIQEKTKIKSRTSIQGKVKLNHELTFYSARGDYLGRISLILSVLVLIFYFFRRTQ